MYTHFLHSIHPSIPFPCHLPPPTGTKHPAGRTCSTLLFSDFVEERIKWHFCLFVIKVAIQGISLWYFHVYVYYNPNWFISSIFFSFYLSSFLMVVSASLKILYSFLYREYINHIHVLSFLLLPYPSHMWLPLTMTSFS
jgi:hypothetical protein